MSGGLSQIAGPENSVIHLHPADNVVVARTPLSAGSRVLLSGREVRVLEAVPPGHKLAVASIPAGGWVLRYGERIGVAPCAIEEGRHVHTHNLTLPESAADYIFPKAEIPYPEPPGAGPAFLGYRREDGRTGTRNYIAVVAASNCAAHTAALIAQSYRGQALPPNVDGVVAFPHGDGCGHAMGPDSALLERTFRGILDHPNVSAAVLVGLGCETNQVAAYLDSPQARAGRLAGLTLQQSGGTGATVEAARRELARLLDRASAEQRVATPASGIVLGLNCGGSDSFSGITANPALGHCSDLLVRLGATVVLGETPEIVGAEHLLVARARNRQVAQRVLDYIAEYRRYLARFGECFDDNPSPGNKAGGLTNIVEKSLGAVAKAGSTPLMEAVDYSERVRGPGFVFMNTPGYDPVSLAGLAAGGVNLIVFTTGRGSAIGFPTVPVLKIASNSATFHRMRDNMDVNAGRIADGEAGLEEVGREILDRVLEAASGARTAAETWGHSEFVPWRIGPVM